MRSQFRHREDGADIGHCDFDTFPGYMYVGAQLAEQSAMFCTSSPFKLIATIVVGIAYLGFFRLFAAKNILEIGFHSSVV